MDPTRSWLARVAVAGTLIAIAAPAAAATRPNVVVVLADDMRYADLEYMPRTRELIGRRGMQFARSYLNVSLCCPSRATTLTGRYAQNTRVFSNGAPTGGFAAFRDEGNERRTIATALAAGGYRTALIGKYLNGYASGDRTYVPPGWSDWRVPTGAAYGQYNYELNENGSLRRYGEAPEDYLGDVLAQKARAFITASVEAQKPFFVLLSLLTPHTPAVPAPRHADLYADVTLPRDASFNEADVGDKPPFFRLPRLTAEQIARLDNGNRQRLRTLPAIDEAVAAIHRQLEASGELEDTFIVFTSDNGFRMGEHRLGIGKETAYEEDIRVPLLVRGPGIEAGQWSGALVDNADLAPTIADWAGVSAPAASDGRSLTPLLGRATSTTRSETVAVQAAAEAPGWRRAIPVAHYNASGAYDDEVVPGGIFRGLPRVKAPEWHGLRSARWLYVEYATGDRELYDRVTDPQQLRNLAGSADPALLRALSVRTRALARCAAAECRRLENAPLPE